MEIYLLRRQSVNPAFGHGEVLEDRHRLLLHPIGKPAVSDQLPYLSEGAAMLMRVGVAVRVCMVVGMRLVRVVVVAG